MAKMILLRNNQGDILPTKSFNNRIALVGSLGTAIEFYDFTLFGIFTPILSEVFFTESALKLTMIIFAGSFLMRPFGALVFGHIGDKIGRKPALTLTILLMSIPTFIIGILPTYDSIGIAAPILLTVCRLTQGFFAGGEHNGAAVYVLEHWPKNQSGRASAIVIAGVFLGVFSAVISGILVMMVFPSSFAWRIPFILGVLIGLIGFYIRRKLSETPDFEKLSHPGSKNKLPSTIVFSQAFYPLLTTFVVGGFAGVIGYTIAVYLGIHLTSHVGLSLNVSMFMCAACMFMALISSMIVGKFSDKYGPINVLIFASILIIVNAYPIYNCLHNHSINIILSAVLILGLLTGMYCSPIHAVINQMFPVSARYTGTSLGYSIGMSVFGGTTPIISTLLIDTLGSPTAPATYIIIIALINLFMLFIWKLQKKDPLN